MFSKRQIAFIMSLVYLLLALAALAFIYYVVPWILVWLLPFIIAYFFSAVATPLAKLFNKFLKIPLKAARAVSIILVFVIFGFLIGFLIFKIVSELSMLAAQTPKYVEMTKNIINNLPLIIKDLYKNLPPDSVLIIDNLVNALSLDVQSLQQYASRAMDWIGGFITNIPSTIIFIFFTLISSFFLTVDRDLVRTALKKIMPSRVYNGIAQARKNFKEAIFGYLKAEIIIYFIVVTELLIGLSILRVDYVIILAFVIALIDAIPIFGVGTVLIPWALVSMFFKDYRLGVSLLALYAIMFTVRQIIEPKIVSSQIGLHPLLTLLSMYAGLKAFGFLGMLLSPMVVIIVINLYKTGTFSPAKKNSLFFEDVKGNDS